MRARKWFHEAAQRGATAIEYGLIAALVAVVIITGLTALGSSLDNKFSSVADTVQSTGGGAASDEDDSATETPAPTASTLPTSTLVSLTSELSTDATADEPASVREDALCWKGPGDDYEIVSSLIAGTEVTVLGRGIVPGWWVIDNPRFAGVACWTPQEALEVGSKVDVPETLFSVPTLPTDPLEPAGGGSSRPPCLLPDPNSPPSSVQYICHASCPVPNEQAYGSCTP